MGKQGVNQFGFEDCSPLFPCEVCVIFNSFKFKKCYPRGMDPNLTKYHNTVTPEQLLESLKK